MKAHNAIPVCTLLGIGNLATPALAEGFIEDSKVSLQTKNFYLNRDFRDGAGQNKRDEWAQGSFSMPSQASRLALWASVLTPLGCSA